MEEKKTPGEVLVPGLEVVTVKGEKLKVPKTTLKKEIEIGRVLFEVLKEVYSLDVVKKGEFKVEELLDTLPGLVKTVPDKLIKIASIIVEKEEGWVLDNLDIEGLVQLLAPFFSKLSKLVAGLPVVKTRARILTK